MWRSSCFSSDWTSLTLKSMAVAVGYPPTGSCFDWSIDRFCELGNTHTLTDDLRYHLIIQRFCYRVSRVMSANVCDPLGLPPDSQHPLMMKVLEHDLNTLEGQIFGKLSRKIFNFDLLSAFDTDLKLDRHRSNLFPLCTTAAWGISLVRPFFTGENDGHNQIICRCL
jgi:hypothetical protein